MSTRWQGDEAPLRWWQALGVLLLVTGVGPIMLAQLAWWAWTGTYLR